MKVAVVERFGGPEVLVTREVPDPVAGPGEALIAVEAADVLWVETMIRRGAGAPYFDVSPPYVPGSAVAGRVGSVGAGVDPAWVGRPVVAHLADDGGYAEQVNTAADRLVALPEGVGPRPAAALAHDGVTALALAEATGVTTGRRVLVVGASGGLGIISVQLARARGARVVATGRGTEKLRRIRDLGADAVIDTGTTGWVDRAREALGGDGADVVLDNIGGAVGEAAFGAVAPGGRFSAHGTPGGRFAEIDPGRADAIGVRLRGIADVQLSPAEQVRLTGSLLTEAAAGRIGPVIGQTFPLERAAAAHAAIEARSVFGKTLLLP